MILRGKLVAGRGKVAAGLGGVAVWRGEHASWLGGVAAERGDDRDVERCEALPHLSRKVKNFCSCGFFLAVLF